MTIGAAIVLIAIGAVMKWAVTAHVNGFDIQTAGTVIFVVGLAGLVPPYGMPRVGWDERRH